MTAIVSTSLLSPRNGAISNFTAVRQQQIADGNRRLGEKIRRTLKGLPTKGVTIQHDRRFGLIHPAIAKAVAGVCSSIKSTLLSTAAPAAKPTPTPSASSDAFKARMVGIMADPKKTTKDELLTIAGTFAVEVKKSWTKDKILVTMALAAGLKSED